jgi:O-antigen/teichoic acid export membrane protein
MHTVMRRVRGALGMGLVWAIGAGMIGGLIELLDNLGVGWGWIGGVDMWPQTLAIPGFLCGVSFSILLGIIARHRRIEQLSVPGVAGLGAIGGALIAALIFLLEGGGSTLVLAYVAGVLALFSATSATATILLARVGTDRDALPPGE